jgi:iron-sulfur cluster repair protein YtfE (RIC family)
MRSETKDLLGMTVNEVIRSWPATVSLFADLGIDACCGGALPVAEAARRHGHDPEKVRARLDSLLDAAAGERA